MSQLTTNVTLKRTPYFSRVPSLIPSAAYTVASTPVISQTLKGTDWYDSFTAMLTITSFDGAGNTIDVYFQGLAPDGFTWFDIANMPSAQMTTAGNYIYTYRPVGAWMFAITDAAIGAGGVNTVNVPTQFRVKIALVGTVTVTFALHVEFYRRSA